MICRAMLDSCSTHNYVSQTLSNQLGLFGKRTNLKMTTLSGTKKKSLELTNLNLVKVVWIGLSWNALQCQSCGNSVTSSPSRR